MLSLCPWPETHDDVDCCVLNNPVFKCRKVCYNVIIMNIDHYEYALECAGFEAAGPDVWGKAIGEVTAFVEVGAVSTLAWVYDPAAERILGAKLRIESTPDRAVPEALFQLEGLLSQEESLGDVSRVAPEAAAEESVKIS
jgi:hypothetical protein